MSEPHKKVMAANPPDVETGPQTRSVIPGYYTLTKKEREQVDKNSRRWRRKKKEGENTFEIDL